MKAAFPLLSEISQTLKIWQAGLARIADFSEQNSIYSINEVPTGESWINNEPIFRKVVTVGALPNAVTKTVPHGINRIKDVLKCAGIAYDPATQGHILLPYIQLAAIGDCLSVQVIRDLIYLYTTTGNYSAYTGYVILEYTKS